MDMASWSANRWPLTCILSKLIWLQKVVQLYDAGFTILRLCAFVWVFTCTELFVCSPQKTKERKKTACSSPRTTSGIRKLLWWLFVTLISLKLFVCCHFAPRCSWLKNQWQHRQQQLTVVCDTPGWWQQSIVDKVERRQIQTQTQCRKSFMLKTDSTFLLYDLLLYMDCKFKNCLTRHCCISVQRSICSPRLI